MHELSGLLTRGKHEYIYHLVYTRNKKDRCIKGSRIRVLEIYKNGNLIIHFRSQWFKQPKNQEAREIYNYIIRRYLHG